MTREIDAASVAESTADVVRPFLAVELDYPDGIVRVCSLQREIEIDGETFFGLGAMGAVSEITEGAEQRSYGVTLDLSGVPGNFSAYLGTQDVQGRRATIKLGFLDAGHVLVGDPTTIFVGRMDTQDITAGMTTSLRVAVESLLIDWERPRIRRYTDIDQQTRYPGDRGFEFVAAVANMEIKWS